MAASGVKVREGRPIGVQRRDSRASELFQLVAGNLIDGLTTHLGGLDLSALCAAAEEISINANRIVEDSDEPLTASLTLYLFPINV